MPVYVALLRAVNVGGTAVLTMRDLVAMCEEAGFRRVKTYIQSGNIVFEADGSERDVKATLEAALSSRLGKPSTAILRTAAETRRVLGANPFPHAEPAKVIVLFLDDPAPPDAAASVKPPAGEQVVFAGREVFVHYPEGMGRSKLALPQAKYGTGRNLNTVARLAQMADDLRRSL